jgi:2-polyprenyl-6-methoxyphenol hydroxylase-like FAD-dependent oxidoreductase
LVSGGERVLVIGGGIGGLAAAVALRRVGFRVRVLERAPELAEVGAGLSLWSNAICALDRMGLAHAVVSRSSPIERAVTVTSRGEVLSDLSLGAACRQAGYPSVCAHRAELQGVLAGALETEDLRLGAECVSVVQDPRGARVRLANGDCEEASVVVGADGIHSVVRAELLGASAPRAAGYGAYRGVAHVVPPDLPPSSALFALGRGAQAGVVRCGGGRVYWFATVNRPRISDAAMLPSKDDALRRFARWPRTVVAAIEATESGALLWNDVEDRAPAWPLGAGRATLLGDAAHATTPNFGQGACQALEDAVVLADCLRRGGLEPESLRRYETSRRSRTARVIRRSWRAGKVFQAENAWLVWLRDRVARSRMGRRGARAAFETWLQVALPELDDGDPSRRQRNRG